MRYIPLITPLKVWLNTARGCNHQSSVCIPTPLTTFMLCWYTHSDSDSGVYVCLETTIIMYYNVEKALTWLVCFNFALLGEDIIQIHLCGHILKGIYIVDNAMKCKDHSYTITYIGEGSQDAPCSQDARQAFSRKLLSKYKFLIISSDRGINFGWNSVVTQKFSAIDNSFVSYNNSFSTKFTF